MAISAWSDILGPTNAVRIGQLSGHSTDEVKTYIRNSDEANLSESIGLLGPIKIGSSWGRTGNALMRMERDRIASEDLAHLEVPQSQMPQLQQNPTIENTGRQS